MVTTNSINNTVGSSDSGLTNTLTVQNTSNTASSQAQINTTVGGGTSGDAWNQFTIGAITAYSVGIDNTDDKFKLTYAASGTATPSDANPFMTFDGAGGQVTQLKPQTATTAFIVNNTTDGAGAQASIVLKNTVATGINDFGIAVANTADTVVRVQGRAEIQTSNASLGLNIAALNTAGTATLIFYTGTNAVTIKVGDVTAAGEWTYPKQPSFLGYLFTTATNKTGAGTTYTLGTDALTEVYDQGADFTTAGVFTAPVTGIYDLRAQITVTGNTVATTFVIAIVTTTATYQKTFIKAAGAQDETVSISVLAAMTATNTATTTITVTGEAGDTSDIKGGTPLETFFCGTLVA